MKNYKATKIQVDRAMEIRIQLGVKYELAQKYLKLGQLENALYNPSSAMQLLNIA
ncbi:MAG: hypothetical protein ACJA01_002068 [Saprospiraceae bacterium]|jgi:hypothetical protein